MGMTDSYRHHLGDPEYLTKQTQELKKKLAEWCGRAEDKEQGGRESQKLKIKAFVCNVGWIGGGETPFLFSEMFICPASQIYCGDYYFSALITASFLSLARTYAHNVINPQTDNVLGHKPMRCDWVILRFS